MRDDTVLPGAWQSPLWIRVEPGELVEYGSDEVMSQ